MKKKKKKKNNPKKKKEKNEDGDSYNEKEKNTWQCVAAGYKKTKKNKELVLTLQGSLGFAGCFYNTMLLTLRRYFMAILEYA